MPSGGDYNHRRSVGGIRLACSHLNVYLQRAIVKRFVRQEGKIPVSTHTKTLRVEQITLEQAQEYLGYKYGGQRKVRPYYVNYLFREMVKGRFQETAEVHIVNRFGDWVLVNGQHTLHAFVKYAQLIEEQGKGPAKLAVTVRKSEAKEVGEVSLMYTLGHDNGLLRTFSDAVGAYRLDDETGLAKGQVDSLSAALRHIKNGFADRGGGEGHMKIATLDLIDDVITWAPEAKTFFQITAFLDSRINILLRKKAVMSVALMTIYYQVDKAVEFWREVARPNALDYRDPRVTCRNLIIDSRRGSTKSQVTRGKLSRQIAHCWNAYFLGEQLAQPKVRDDMSLIVLEGTPYNGQQPMDFLSIKNEQTLPEPAKVDLVPRSRWTTNRPTAAQQNMEGASERRAEVAAQN